MRRMSLHLRGPIRRPLWKRLRRRLVRTSSAGFITALLAGGALYVASAVEPNLSGIWVRDDGDELRLFHVGNRVTAIFEQDGVTSFEANFSAGSRLEGYINLWWQGEESKRKCGHFADRDEDFKATVNKNYDVLQYQWTGGTDPRGGCKPTDFETHHSTLRRKTY